MLSDMRGKRILINPIDDYCDYKGELFMANKKFSVTINAQGTLHEKAGFIEYKMPERMAQEYLKSRKGDDAKMRPNDYLCKVVNENFGLKGHCVKVIRY